MGSACQEGVRFQAVTLVTRAYPPLSNAHTLSRLAFFGNFRPCSQFILAFVEQLGK